MRKPNEIQKELDEITEKLKKELSESKAYHEWEKLDCETDDTVGFHDLGKMRTILAFLYAGHTLKVHHGGFGDYAVYMNPQRNRILVDPIKKICSVLINGKDEGITEEKILGFICNYPTIWYKKVEV